MRVSEIMTSAVIVTHPEKTILEAVSLMIEHRISGLPVVNTLGEPVGVVTEGDLLRRAELGTEKQRSRWVRFFSSLGSEASEYALTHARRVAEVMTTNPIAVSPSSPLEKVVTLMEIHNVRQI
jgi:CBS domain-containing protein